MRYGEEYGREFIPQTIIKRREETGKVAFNVYSRIVDSYGDTALISLDGSAAYSFVVAKAGLTWNYQQPETWLSKSEKVQRRFTRKSAENLAYLDARRFAEVVARGIRTKVLDEN